MDWTYNARNKVGEGGQRDASSADICGIYFGAVDEAGGVDEEAVEEDEEHDL